MKKTLKAHKKCTLERDLRVLFLFVDYSRATVYVFMYIKFKLAYLMLITFVIFRVCVYLPCL